MPSAAIFAAACVVGQAVDVDPVVDALLDARLRRIGTVDAAVIGENLEALAVVLLHHVGHGEADGVVAQVRRDIADLQAERVGPAGRRGHRLRPADGMLGVVPALGELEHRVVGEVRQRQRRYAGEQVAALDPLPFGQHRPFALPLAQRHPVLQCLGLTAVDVEALLEDVLGGAVVVVAFQHPARLMQHGELVRDRLAVDRGQLADELHPFGDRRRRPGRRPRARGRD